MFFFVGTPGLITTRSIWSSNHEGASPPINPTPSAFKARASSDHSSTGLRSCSATVAPRRFKKRAADAPLLPAPITKTFLPASSIEISAQLQRRQTKQREQDRNDEKTKNDFRFFPRIVWKHLEVMMQRRHPEKFLSHSVSSFRKLEVTDLKNHREHLDDENSADHHENEFLFRQHADCADCAADGETADIAHEDFSGRRVVP